MARYRGIRAGKGAEEKEIRIVYLGTATVVRMETSTFADVCVSHKTHLFPVQVGNACVKEGNTHVNDKDYTAPS